MYRDRRGTRRRPYSQVNQEDCGHPSTTTASPIAGQATLPHGTVRNSQTKTALLRAPFFIERKTYN